jgi:hypothetical protein
MRITKFLLAVPLLIIGFIVDFYAMAKVLFDDCYRYSAFDLFRQIKLWRLVSRAMVAMKVWCNKVADKDYVLLFGGKKDFTVLRNTAFG